jgi:hypothetical protein
MATEKCKTTPPTQPEMWYRIEFAAYELFSKEMLCTYLSLFSLKESLISYNFLL